MLSFGNKPVNENELLKNDIDITFENQPYNEILNMDFTNCKSYKILKNYSLYGIDPIIGIFDLKETILKTFVICICINGKHSFINLHFGRPLLKNTKVLLMIIICHVLKILIMKRILTIHIILNLMNNL